MTITASPLPATIAPGDTGHIDHHDRVHEAFDAAIWDNAVNVMHADYGAESGGDATLNTDAINLAVTDLVGTGRPGFVVIPLGVDLPVNEGDVMGASDVRFVGGGTLSTTGTAVAALITFPDGSARCGVDGLTFRSPGNHTIAVLSIHNDDVTVTRCSSYGPRLWVGNDTSVAYADNDGTNVTTNATITDNVCVAAATPDTSACIWAFYARGGKITGNTVIGHAQGIVGWGGDADADGAIANERKASGFAVTDNIVTDTLGGGMWFSMCSGLTVATNVVTGSGDVGIDFEGCVACTASGNTSTNNVGGNFTTFFYNRGVRFTANTGYLDGTGAQVMVRTANTPGSTDNRDVTYDGNTFLAEGVIGVISLEVAQRLTFTRNVLTNCRVDTQFNNQLLTTISENRFLFTEAAGSALYAIKAGQNHGGGRLVIAGNEIINLVSQPAGSLAIRVAQDDPTVNVVTHIDDNELIGWGSTPAKVLWTGSNAGVHAYTMIRRNNLDVSPAAVNIDNTGAVGPHTVVSTGNYYDDTTAAP